MHWLTDCAKGWWWHPSSNSPVLPQSMSNNIFPYETSPTSRESICSITCVKCTMWCHEMVSNLTRFRAHASFCTVDDRKPSFCRLKPPDSVPWVELRTTMMELWSSIWGFLSSLITIRLFIGKACRLGFTGIKSCSITMWSLATAIKSSSGQLKNCEGIILEGFETTPTKFKSVRSGFRLLNPHWLKSHRDFHKCQKEFTVKPF